MNRHVKDTPRPLQNGPDWAGWSVLLAALMFFFGAAIWGYDPEDVFACIFGVIAMAVSALSVVALLLLLIALLPGRR